MSARLKGLGDLKARISGVGERARQLSPVTFRARMRLDEEERKRLEAAEKPDAAVPRRLSRHFGSYSPTVF